VSNLQHLTDSAFQTYLKINKHLSQAITLLHGLDVHEAKISAEHDNAAEMVAHALT
jgi:hypothetical protein